MRCSFDGLLTCLLSLVIFTGTTLSDLHQTDLFVKTKAKILSAIAAKVEWLNDTCQQSNHYYYKQLVCVNSPPPETLKPFFKRNQSDSMDAVEIRNTELHMLNYKPKFKILHFGTAYDEIIVYKNGEVMMHTSEMVNVYSSIFVLYGDFYNQPIEIITNANYSAIRWPEIRIVSNRKWQTAQAILTVYQNGVISIYYENIPSEINVEELESSMEVNGGSHFEDYNHISVPQLMIKTSTLVQFEPTEKYCSKAASYEACNDASTLEVKCYWCEGIQKCSNGFDVNTDAWIRSKCNNTLMINEVSKFPSLTASNEVTTSTSTPSDSSLKQQATTATQVILQTTPVNVSSGNSDTSLTTISMTILNVSQSRAMPSSLTTPTSPAFQTTTNLSTMSTSYLASTSTPMTSQTAQVTTNTTTTLSTATTTTITTQMISHTTPTNTTLQTTQVTSTEISPTTQPSTTTILQLQNSYTSLFMQTFHLIRLLLYSVVI